jgi:hypothetical protein
MYGTLSVLDTLAATQQSVVDYGEDRAWDQINVLLAVHNQQMQDMLGDLIERTTDRQRRYGTTASKTMQELDEFGRPQPQKVTAGATLGFPLRLYGDALQWTRKFLQTGGSAAQMAAEIRSMLDSDRRLTMYELKRALFTPTNYTFADRLIDGVDLSVKALINADSSTVPLGPNGETFDGATHTHYLYTASTSLAAADVSGLQTTVRQHSAMGTVDLYINSAQETAMRGLTGFVAHIYGYISRGGGATADVTNQALSPNNPGDRSIGFFGESEVFVKPWVASGYVLAINNGTPDRPLILRTRPGAGELQLVSEFANHPLQARSYEREFGIGVYNRVAAAVLFIDAGGAGAYTAPTLTN